jgi:hypothetical protein
MDQTYFIATGYRQRRQISEEEFYQYVESIQMGGPGKAFFGDTEHTVFPENVYGSDEDDWVSYGNKGSALKPIQ